MDWKNRIVGYGELPADQFQANPYNPRTHPEVQRRAVESSLNELGWIAPVIVNKTTGHVVDGHERIWQALGNGNASVPYVEVELTEQEEKLALMTYDYITLMAEYDRVMLETLQQQIEEDTALDDVIGQMAKEFITIEPDSDLSDSEHRYSRKIDIPIYKPSSVEPKISDMFDFSKTDALIKRIQASNLAQYEKDFLTIAAYRHTVFNYAKIADFYAHGSPERQRLMEDSALVIIDFDRALELGYTKLTEDIARMVGDENPE